ncbi:MAG: barstar family protein [Rhodocyclaceae bacterium]|nr:barstar family protein [Rhodocyclaceae bacterium]
MNDYTTILANPELAGVFEIPEEGIDAIIAAAEANQHVVYRVDLRAVRSRDQMLQTVGEGLELPTWFGSNFDALMDCLCDFSWVPASGYTIIMENCHNIHSIAYPDFNMMIDLFAEAANAWREQDKPFWCFVDLPSNV